MNTETSGPGRPQDVTIHQRIIEATLEIIGLHGVQAITFEKVAIKARTTRPAIYRRWHSKEDLIAEALERNRPHMVTPNTGSLKGDLYEATNDFISQYSTPVSKQAVLEILKARSFGSPAVETWFAKYGTPRQDEFRLIFTRAIERGELSPETDIQTIMFTLSSCLLQLCMLSDSDSHDEMFKQAKKVIELVLPRASKPVDHAQ